MLSLAQLLNALKAATSELKELKVVWWLVGASLVAAIALRLFGSGHAAVIAVGVSLVGVVFSFIVSALANSAASGNKALILPSQILVWAVLMFFVVFLLFTIAAVLWCQPVAWANILGLQCRVSTQGVHMTRHADFTKVGCSAGQRHYVEVIEDRLTFKEPLDIYTVTAEKDALASHTLSIAYKLGDGPLQELGLLQNWQPRLNSISHLEQDIQVSGASAVTVFYRWEQHPKPDDDSFGLAFVSSLPILSIEASADLPPGKEVSGLSMTKPNHRMVNEQLTAVGCRFNAGPKPGLSCPTQVTSKPDSMRILAWTWNVFEGC